MKRSKRTNLRKLLRSKSVFGKPQYKSKWKPYSLNKPYWNEVLKDRKIVKLEFNDHGLSALVLDSGEKVYLPCGQPQQPNALWIKDDSRD
ncbi:hypothetical protein [Methylobacter sp.]|uniref:hypothetical protein n=1 Tax=Methylobacter sp. TaxID=2051955 RepID=UPI001208C2EE|nr:hypothetical protein [Methylobacter sp.]TAK59515.1 MAG: hypothetical protein EPO18_20350 [Methylobacter sp.]